MPNKGTQMAHPLLASFEYITNICLLARQSNSHHPELLQRPDGRNLRRKQKDKGPPVHPMRAAFGMSSGSKRSNPGFHSEQDIPRCETLFVLARLGANLGKVTCSEV